MFIDKSSRCEASASDPSDEIMQGTVNILGMLGTVAAAATQLDQLHNTLLDKVEAARDGPLDDDAQGTGTGINVLFPTWHKLDASLQVTATDGISSLIESLTPGIAQRWSLSQPFDFRHSLTL